MAFFFEYLKGSWDIGSSKSDQADLEKWEGFLSQVDDDRKRDRIMLWKDRTVADDYAVNAEEPEFYRRTAGFVWRFKDMTGVNKARNHQYLYNLEVYGHRQVSRRDEASLAKAAAEVASRAATGELGPLSPLE